MDWPTDDPQPSDGGPSLPRPATVQAIVEATRDGVCFFARESGLVTYANRAARALFGYSPTEWKTLTIADLLSDCDHRAPSLTPELTDSHICHRDGHAIPVQWCLIGSEQDSTVVAMFRAIAGVAPVSEADLDPLTGLPNRRVFEQHLQDTLEEGQSDFAVFFVDLNGFKEVNDVWGHVVGDQVLRVVAERLPTCLRPVDMVARYGGDEFVVLLKHIDRVESAEAAARRLLQSISEPIPVTGTTIDLTASAGIVLGSSKASSVADTVHAADRAMYRAKQLGPGRYALWEH